eukprot:COSAG02_NODE_71626_length_190_cov_32.912088_1_plen_52_part_10
MYRKKRTYRPKKKVDKKQNRAREEISESISCFSNGIIIYHYIFFSQVSHGVF